MAMSIDAGQPRLNEAFKQHAQTRMSSLSSSLQDDLLSDDPSTSRGSLGHSWPVSGCSVEESPRLIPTPGYVSPASSLDTNREEGTSSFSDHEVMAITKAKEFVNKLRLRFDVEPERLKACLKCLEDWLYNGVSIATVTATINGHLDNSHPDDELLRNTFDWFIQGSKLFNSRPPPALPSRSKRATKRVRTE